MSDKRVTISGQYDAPLLSAPAALILALEVGSFDRDVNPFLLAPGIDILRLEMDDAWGDDDVANGFVMPRLWQVAAVRDFVQFHPLNAIHIACAMGMSRSTALALVPLWIRRRLGQSEHEIVAELRTIRPSCAPNPLIVQHVDTLLGTNFADFFPFPDFGGFDDDDGF